MIQMFWKFSYFSTKLDIVYLCLPLFTFVYLCSNNASIHKFCACLFKQWFNKKLRWQRKISHGGLSNMQWSFFFRRSSCLRGYYFRDPVYLWDQLQLWNLKKYTIFYECECELSSGEVRCANSVLVVRENIYLILLIILLLIWLQTTIQSWTLDILALHMQYLKYKKNPTMKMKILASMLSPNLHGMACTLCKNIDTLLLHIQSNFRWH